MPIAVDDAEIQMESLLRKGALDRVAVLALETYGAELFAFLIKVSGSESDAREIFSQLVEDMWRGLPMFEFRCSIRSWLYTLARHAYARFRRSPWNQAARRLGEGHQGGHIEFHAGLAQATHQRGEDDLSEIAAVTRTITQAWRRTGVKDSWRSLRESLAPDDRALIVLRVDRQLEWNAIAHVTLGHESPDADALVREGNRLKKRFQMLKADLRRRAREAGLLEGKS